MNCPQITLNTSITLTNSTYYFIIPPDTSFTVDASSTANGYIYQVANKGYFIYFGVLQCPQMDPGSDYFNASGLWILKPTSTGAPVEASTVISIIASTHIFIALSFIMISMTNVSLVSGRVSYGVRNISFVGRQQSLALYYSM